MHAYAPVTLRNEHGLSLLCYQLGFKLYRVQLSNQARIFLRDIILVPRLLGIQASA